MKSLLLILIVLIIFVGCGGDGKSSYIKEESFTTQNIKEVDENFTTIEKGYINVDTNFSKNFQIISSKLEFNKLFVTTGNSTNVNFNDTILGFILGNRPSKEFSIKVNSIKRVNPIKDREYIKVSLETTIIKDECIKEKREVLPFIFISTPIKYYEQFIFEEDIKILKCTEVNLNETPQIVAFKKIESDSIKYNSGFKSKFIKIIQNSKAVEDLYADGLNEWIELPSINFENETLIVISMGESSNHGYYTDIIEINEYSDYIEIKIENSYPWASNISQPLETSPASFITIPKTNKEIIFKEYVNIF